MNRRCCTLTPITCALLAAASVTAGAQEKYRDPPEPIKSILDAEPLPSVSVSPNKQVMLLMRRPGLPSIAKVATPDLRLAGIRFEPRTSGPTREFSYTGIQIQPMTGGQPRSVLLSLPPN